VPGDADDLIRLLAIFGRRAPAPPHFRAPGSR
jgi:hypothetical protein